MLSVQDCHMGIIVEHVISVDFYVVVKLNFGVNPSIDFQVLVHLIFYVYVYVGGGWVGFYVADKFVKTKVR